MDSNPVIINKIGDLVRELMLLHNIPCHRIESAIEQHSQPGGEDLSIPVIRIITYFEDVVKDIAAILESEFDVSVIMPAADGGRSWADGFSPCSAQYLAVLKANRQSLIEYRSIGSAAFEIQLSTVLQQAWGSIEQHLGFTDHSAIPDDIRRDFFRVGALFELADAELVKVKKQASWGENSVVPNAAEAKRPRTEAVPAGIIAPQKHDTAVVTPEVPHSAPTPPPTSSALGNITIARPPGAIKTETITQSGSVVVSVLSAEAEPGTEEIPYTPPPVVVLAEPHPTAAAPGNERTAYPNVFNSENTPITYASLRDYIKNSRAVREVDMQIATHAGARLNDEIDIEGDVERLHFLRIDTLGQLHKKIEENKADMAAFAEKWIGKDNGGTFDSGISLFYLEYVLVGQRNDPAFAVEYVLKFISDNDYSARYIIPTYSSIKGTEKPYVASHAGMKK
ncbi:MAG: hypothetical protein V4649_04065 [Bacteroidota bacterium]